MKERSFNSSFASWAKANLLRSAAFELKVCGKSLPFSAVKPHQIAGLLHAKHARIFMKLPDVGFQMPFDDFMLVKSEAYVVIRYGSGRVVGIDVDDFIAESKVSERRSLTESVAQKLSTFFY